MLKRMSGAFCALTLTMTGAACTQDGSPVEPPPNTNPPPTSEPLPSALSAVVSTGFEQPGDAVSSHDGKTFYFTAFIDAGEGEMEPAIMSVPSDGGDATVIASGAPLGMPTGLVMSCDNQTLYLADRAPEPVGVDELDRDVDASGALFALSVASGDLTELVADDIRKPAGMALSVDCTTLYVTGSNRSRAPAVFTLSTAGGPVRTLISGAPLVSPTGLHVDERSVAWVMDHLAEGGDGPGVLFAIDDDGQATEVITDLRMGTPGGVSLNSSGSTAFIPTIDENGRGRLTSVALATGAVVHIPAGALTDPAGIRTARNASVFAVVDAENGIIYRAD